MERLKYRAYNSLYANIYFWRTYQQQEIDLIEEREGNLYGYEFKRSPSKKVRPPALWGETYKNSEFKVIHPNNYLDFVVEEKST